MAQTKRKRRTKHRGTAAGSVQTRGRTSKPSEGARKDQGKQSRAVAREERLNKPPTWARSAKTAALAAGFLFLFLVLTGPKKDRLEYAVVVTLLLLLFYIPAGYYLETFLYRRRQAKKAPGRTSAK